MTLIIHRNLFESILQYGVAVIRNNIPRNNLYLYFDRLYITDLAELRHDGGK